MPTTNPDYQPPLGDAVPNTPPAPNPPQAPSGTSVTNTGKTETATQTMLSNTGQNVPQQGTGAISNVSSITIAGVPQAALQVNNWSSGAVGSPGSKFS